MFQLNILCHVYIRIFIQRNCKKNCLQLTAPNKAKNLVVNTRTLDSLTLKWDAGDGDNSGFTVSLQGVPGKSHDTDQREWSFSRLTAGREYTVVVVTKSGDKTSESLTGKFTTSKCFSVLRLLHASILYSA